MPTPPTTYMAKLHNPNRQSQYGASSRCQAGYLSHLHAGLRHISAGIGLGQTVSEDT